MFACLLDCFISFFILLFQLFFFQALLTQPLGEDNAPADAAAAPASDDAFPPPLPVDERTLDNLDGAWNIQCDATVSRLMDFSDYFVLPHSPLPAVWRMNWAAVRNATALGPDADFEAAARCAPLCRRLFGTDVVDEARERRAQLLAELGAQAKYRSAASLSYQVHDVATGRVCGVRGGGKPAYCMCWHMELDDSVVSSWALNEGDGDRGDALWARLEAWLPPVSIV